MSELTQYIKDYCFDRYNDGYDFIECLDIDTFIRTHEVQTPEDAAIALDEFADWWCNRAVNQSFGNW